MLSKGAVFRYRHPGEFLTVVVAAPLQQSGASALSLDEGYCQALPAQYARRRDHLLTLLESAGFRCFRPDGAYYAVDGVFAFGAWGDLALRVSPDRHNRRRRRLQIELLCTLPWRRPSGPLQFLQKI